MQPSASWRPRRGLLRVPALVAALTLVVVLPSGCAQVHDQLTGATVAASTALSPDSDLLAVTDWSVTGGLVSVIVRNDRTRTLETADVTLVGLDASGMQVGAWTSSTPLSADGCCQVTDLAPGDTFGLSFPVGTQAADIASIRLDYRDLGWSSATVATSSITAALRGSGLASGNTAVLATLTDRGTTAPVVVVQAVLRGRSGRLYAVATDRFSCLPAQGSRDVVLTLFQPVPVGVRVARLVARPLSGGARPDCTATPAG